MAIPTSKNARLFYRVARQRLEDARFLEAESRTTASVYLAGYGIECIIKSLIFSQIPESEEPDLLALFRGARAHDFEWLMRLYRESNGPQLPVALVADFARVNTWTTQMRYLPGTIKRREAKAFIASAAKIIEWADGRL